MRRLAGLVGACFLVFGGCTSFDDTQRDVQGTQIRAQNVTYDRVWDTTLATVGKHLVIHDSDKETGIIHAKAPLTDGWPFPWPWRELVTVFISPTANNSVAYVFDVQSGGFFRQEEAGRDWEKIILADIAAGLGAR